MKQLSSLMALIVATFIFLACGEQVAMQGYESSKTTGSIDLIIKEIGTNEPIDSAKVSWYIDGTQTSAYTDSLGSMTIADLPRGTYGITLEKAGFAAMEITIDGLNSLGDAEIPVLPDVDKTYYMHTLTATISGAVKITDIDDNKTLAHGVTVDLQLPETSDFREKHYTTETDSNGIYTFSNLPERVETYELSTRTLEIGEFKYAATTPAPQSNLKPDESVKVLPVTLSIEANSLSVDSYNSDVKTNDTIKVNFSDIIDLDKIKRNHITVTSGGSTIAADYAFSEDNRTMYLYAIQGNWGEVGAYTLRINLSSIYGRPLNTSLTFTVENLTTPGNIIGLMAYNGLDTLVDYGTDEITLTWNSIPGVDGYDIYKKSSVDSNFSLVSYPNFMHDTTATISANLSFEDATTNEFMVIGYTDTKQSEWSDAQTIILKDVIAPTLDTSYSFSLYNTYLDRSDSITTDTLITRSFRSTADVDTSATLSLSMMTNTALELSYEWDGSYSKNLNITIAIPPMTNAMIADSLLPFTDTLLVKGLIDLSLNEASTKKIPVLFR
ncbi:MAG: carboxypeptidase-like regulatory domain-containing protein [Fibrobacterales bacterium]